MTVLVVEGFDHVTSASDLFAGILMLVSATASASAGVGSVTQFGGQCLIVSTSAAATSAAYAAIFVSTGAATIVVGTAVLLSPTAAKGYDIGIMNGIVCHMFCRFTLDQVVIYRGDPTDNTAVQIAAGRTGLISNGWAYVEIRATIGTGAAGAVRIYVNGLQVLDFLGLNTSVDGTATVRGIALGAYDATGSGFTASFDDIYVVDTFGTSPNNGPLGPTRVILRLPAANGSVSFTPVADTNWKEVSDLTFDGDATYNYTSALNTDTFSSIPLPVTTTRVFAVQVRAAVRKDDIGNRTMATVLSSGNIQATGSVITLTPAYQYISSIVSTDPNTSSAWNIAGVNASTFGYTVAS